MPPPDRGAAGGPARDPAPRLDLDDVDAILLDALQADARLPQAALGARVGLSAAAVNRRLRRLTDAGVIRRTSAVLAPELLGVPLTVVVGVSLVSERLDLIDEVGEVAEAADAKHLVVSHYSDLGAEKVDVSKWRRLAQRGYGGRATIGEDLDRFTLPARGHGRGRGRGHGKGADQ